MLNQRSSSKSSLDSMRSSASNQAFRLTRLPACLLGGPASGEDLTVQRPCTSPAVQLNAGVRRLVGEAADYTQGR